MRLISNELNHSSTPYPIELRIAIYQSAQYSHLLGIRQFLQLHIISKHSLRSNDKIHFFIHLYLS